MNEFTEYHLLDEVFQGKFDNFRKSVNDKNITNLNLFNKVKNCNLKLIGEALKATQITYVDLSSNEIDNQGAKDFGKALRDTKVTHIVLKNNNIGNRGAKDLGEALKDTSVTHIDLSSNEICNRGAKDFGKFLKDTKVTHVNLADNKISKRGAKDFGEALKGTQVTHVDISFNYIGKQGAKDFGEVLKGTQVTHVDISFNNITVQGAKDISNCIPDTLLLKVDVGIILEKYIHEAVKSNVDKYIHTPYYLTALRLLPEQEQKKYTNIKEKGLETNEPLKYACGILMMLPIDMVSAIYDFLPLANKNKRKTLKYLEIANEHHKEGLFIESNLQALTDLQSAFADLSLNKVSDQSEEDLIYCKSILNQYHSPSERKTRSSVLSILTQGQNQQRNTLLKKY